MFPRPRRFILALLAPAVAAAIPLGGCRDSRHHDAPADGTITIIVGGIDKVIYLPAKLSEQLGYFADEGLKVRLLSEQGGSTAEISLISGDAQGVVGFYDHTIDLQTKGKCIQSVVQMANIPGEVEVVSTKMANIIKGPADFRGKKLGYTSPGSSTDFLTQYLAIQHGISSADYTGVKAGAGSTFIAAIDQGSIDAGMTTDPTVAQLLRAGKAKVLVDMRTEEGTRAALGGSYPSSSLYMNCDYVARYGNTVQKLANALVKSLRYIADHSAADIASKMPKDFAAGNPALYIEAIHDSKTMFNRDGRMPPDGAQDVLEVLGRCSANVRGKKESIDLSKTYTTEFVDQAARALAK
ncbi:ABC transporter substrate-binding protein [Pendulispora albinea]|uniref:ABC transporter substrate-binding protein n=1 Tax=Pendulispora albinea TaxID=2741071 RepID=A0ABZ2M9J0_9BACT